MLHSVGTIVSFAQTGSGNRSPNRAHGALLVAIQRPLAASHRLPRPDLADLARDVFAGGGIASPPAFTHAIEPRQLGFVIAIRLPHLALCPGELNFASASVVTTMLRARVAAAFDASSAGLLVALRGHHPPPGVIGCLLTPFSSHRTAHVPPGQPGRQSHATSAAPQSRHRL